jgi:hypothetical protein
MGYSDPREKYRSLTFLTYGCPILSEEDHPLCNSKNPNLIRFFLQICSLNAAEVELPGFV